jgi:hypothetical protein
VAACWRCCAARTASSSSTCRTRAARDSRSRRAARLVVSDYFLNEDDFGKVQLEGDHHVRVIEVFKRRLALDTRFDIDFNAAFTTEPPRRMGSR